MTVIRGKNRVFKNKRKRRHVGVCAYISAFAQFIENALECRRQESNLHGNNPTPT